MPIFTTEQLLSEESPVEGSSEPNRTMWISEVGGLTQFGSFIEILQPGGSSSIKHWHSAEDEMIYVLEGVITVIEGNEEKEARAGDSITFKAGVPVGHCLVNRSNVFTKCLVVGTRAPYDRITYPDHNRVCIRDRSVEDDAWVDFDGNPADSPYK
jgi:uncharacterized cupin superfamily protein